MGSQWQRWLDNNVLIRSGEAPGIGWSRNMLYSGFNILHRSVIRRQTGFAARITRTLCRSNSFPRPKPSAQIMPTHPTNFENKTNAMFSLYLEPWGSDFWLAPGEIFEVVPQNDSPDYHLHIINYADGVQVYVQGGGDAIVCCNGKELQCGHQRPSEPE